MALHPHGPIHPESTGLLEPERNQLLSGLDTEAERRLRPHLKPVTLQAREVLYPPGAQIRQIYFPKTAVLCMLTVMEDGRTIESATVGREGASWISGSMAAPTMPCQTMVAIAGAGLMADVRFVEEEIQQNGSFRQALKRYLYSLLIHTLRTGSCNGLHSLRERCARWMLTTLDRTSAEDFAVTHEFLASLLGCTRPVLTGVLGELEQRGAIALHRGSIHIVDRKQLEACSCECYWVIRRYQEGLQKKPEQQS